MRAQYKLDPQQVEIPEKSEKRWVRGRVTTGRHALTDLHEKKKYKSFFVIKTCKRIIETTKETSLVFESLQSTKRVDAADALMECGKNEH